MSSPEDCSRVYDSAGSCSSLLRAQAKLPRFGCECKYASKMRCLWSFFFGCCTAYAKRCIQQQHCVLWSSRGMRLSQVCSTRERCFGIRVLHNGNVGRDVGRSAADYSGQSVRLTKVCISEMAGHGDVVQPLSLHCAGSWTGEVSVESDLATVRTLRDKIVQAASANCNDAVLDVKLIVAGRNLQVRIASQRAQHTPVHAQRIGFCWQYDTLHDALSLHMLHWKA